MKRSFVLLLATGLSALAAMASPSASGASRADRWSTAGHKLGIVAFRPIKLFGFKLDFQVQGRASDTPCKGVIAATFLGTAGRSVE